MNDPTPPGWLPPELYGLPPAVRTFWASSAERDRALREIVGNLGPGGLALEQAVASVDAAVVGLLAVFGVPRGEINGIQLEARWQGWAGRKDPSCTMLLSVYSLHAALRTGTPDRFMRTWVHESLHGRQPYTGTAALEHRRTAGYEEGLVEGLARHLLYERLRWVDIGGSFERYVAGYRSLAEAAGFDVVQLWQHLWPLPTGQVRARFGAAVDDLYWETHGERLTDAQRAALSAIADRVFDTDEARTLPDTVILHRLWKRVFR